MCWTTIRALEQSWVYDDLFKVRNVKPALTRFGMVACTAAWTWLHCLGVKRGPEPHGKPDHATSASGRGCPDSVSKPDGKVSFDKLSSVFISTPTTPKTSPLSFCG